ETWTAVYLVRKPTSPTIEFAKRRLTDETTPSSYSHPANVVHPAGVYIREGDEWVQYPPYKDANGAEHNFKHKEGCRDRDYIYTWDHTRDWLKTKDANGVEHNLERTPLVPEPPPPPDVKVITYSRMPINGGKAYWSFGNPVEWKYMFDLVVIHRSPRT